MQSASNSKKMDISKVKSSKCSIIPSQKMEIFTEKFYGVDVDLSACIFLIKHKLSPLQK